VTQKTFIRFSLTISLLSLLWLILSGFVMPQTDQVTTVAPHEGFLAPDFTLTTIEGETVTLSSYEGQPVLVFFWASWCSICKSIMPDLERVHQAASPDGLVILAVNATRGDSLPSARAYFEENNLTYPFLLDPDGQAADAYQVHALPTSVLIMPDGRIQDIIVGSGLTKAYLEAELSNIMESE
jgi:peroxiredoxin